MTREPAFPGGTWVSRLAVYDWPAPGGEAPAGSGSPHLHTVAAEAYVVLAGAGEVQTLGRDGAGTTRLAPGVLVWFEPGVVHRLVNDGDLEILVVMSAAGLPEAGDAVLTFPPDVLADPAAYARAATLPPGGAGEEAVAAAARARRDLALEGFATLRARVSDDGPAALAPLHRAAARLVAGRVPDWRERALPEGLDQAGAVARALAALGAGDGAYLADGAVAARLARPGPRRYGMCGRLVTWPAGTADPD